MNQKTGRNVFVALPQGGALTEIDMLKLLSAAEIDLASVQFIRATSDAIAITANDALVISLSDHQAADASVEAAVLAAARAGSCHIVGVWAPGQSGTAIHADVLQYGTAQVPWSPDDLKHELGSDCANAFQTAEGDAAESNEIEPNECE